MSENIKKVTRNANMDVLRILSMFLIVFLHSIDHSGVLESVAPGTTMYYYVYFGYCISQVCVNCFVLLSGYFMIESKFRPSKLVHLWIEVVFYSLVIRIVFIVTGMQAFSIGSILSCFVPVITGRYWFITIYFGLYLLSPFLNKAIKAMNKKQFSALVVILFLLSSVLSSLHPKIAGMNSGGGWGLAWFVVLYCFAAWVRLYYKPNNKILRKVILLFTIPIFIVFMLFLSNVMNIGILKTIVLHWYSYESIPAIAMSMLLLLIYANVDVKNAVCTKIITALAPLTLGVYLIHAHANVSPWSWEVINLPKYIGEVFFPFVQIFSVVAIFALCAVIDYIRNLLFKHLKFEKILKLIDSKIIEFIGLN
ncbi:MAG: acyltransferase [Clostridia bacterium]|nr:acyltransferase [Clostridia bacterium]